METQNKVTIEADRKQQERMVARWSQEQDHEERCVWCGGRPTDAPRHADNCEIYRSTAPK